MRKAIFGTILLLVLIVTGYIYFCYYNTLSDGYREGVLQTFSHRGNVFKTYEGEMVLLGFRSPANGNGVNANYFYFSVADEALADTLEHNLGKQIRVHYLQYRRSLPWRGENYSDKNAKPGQYMVDRIDEVKDAPMVY